MPAECMFLENGKCLCQKRYYENNKCPDCANVGNCYYKRAIRAEETLSYIDKIIGIGFSIKKVFGEYKLKIREADLTANKLSNVLFSAVKEMEKEDDKE